MLYSRYERRRYIKRQVLLKAGLLDEEIEAEVAQAKRRRSVAALALAKQQQRDQERPPSRARLFFRAWRKQLKTLFTTKHQWLSVLWPQGNRVYPKRFIKVCSLWAAVSMALGLNAMFTFITTKNTQPGEERTVNTWQLETAWGGIVIPLEGIYSFLLSFPFFLLLSLSFARYSILIDFLRY